MKRTHKWIALGLILIGLILINIIVTRIPGQIDMTGENLYTLSRGSREILKKIEEPVVLNFYFSRSLEGLPVTLKNYATRVEDILKQYRRISGGTVRLNVIDPKPDSDQEQDAIRAGIRGIPLGTGESLYFGLQAVQADQEAAIEIFAREREPFLEYDVSELIYQVQQWEKPVLGIITGLPLFGENQPTPPGMPPQQQQQQNEPWALIRELEKTWEVRPVRGDSIPAEINVLAVIHPASPVSDRMQYAMDQFLLAGNPVFVALDPSSYVQRVQQQQNPQQMMMTGPQGSSSDLPVLLSAYGIEYSPSRVIGDFESARRVSPDPGSPPVQYPPLMDIRTFNRDLPATTALEEFTFMEPGSFQLREDSGLEFTRIITTSSNSGTLDSNSLTFMPLDSVRDQIELDAQSYTIAGLVRGQLPSAFPEGPPETGDGGDQEGSSPPEDNGETPLTESVDSSTMLLVADTDFLSDPFSVQTMNFFGTRALQPINDNLSLAVNLIDFISGSRDLLEIRGKGRTSRPFTRVEKMEREAQVRYEQELTALETRLSEVQSRLDQLRQEQQDSQNLVASPEVLQAIEEFQIEEANLRAERREIRRKLREDIEGLKLSLQLINLATMPVLIGIFALFFFTKRNKRNQSTQ